jgi:hypothetical protein
MAHLRRAPPQPEPQSRSRRHRSRADGLWLRWKGRCGGKNRTSSFRVLAAAWKGRWRSRTAHRDRCARHREAALAWISLRACFCTVEPIPIHPL